MNNRKWLETLSDEEYASQIKHIVMTATNSKGDINYQDLILTHLQRPHTTTADEDFAEIGFALETTQPLYICYADDNGRLLYILKHQNEYDTNNEGWGDELVDTVRKIADKKRKELGWIEGVAECQQTK